MDKLAEVLERLREGDHLAALGAAEGLDELVRYVMVVLNRLAILTRAKSTNLPN